MKKKPIRARKLFGLKVDPVYVYSDKSIIAFDYKKYDESKNRRDEWYKEDGFFILITRQSGSVISVEFIGPSQITDLS